MAQTYFGPGDKSCGAWSQARRDGDARSIAYQVWFLGFVSGVSVTLTLGQKSPDFLKNMDAPGLIAWVDKYCAAHPLDKLLTAAIELIDELQQKSH
jgi:hypothetical protein